MRNSFVAAAAWLLIGVAALGQTAIVQATVVQAAEPAVAAIDFTNDIGPILTKAGCNGGGCHGKSTGRGGFKLSLFGFEPDQDYESIARGSRGRRVFPAAPDESLLLRKATMSIPHGGGRRLDVGDPEYETLRQWIIANLPWQQPGAARIQRLEIEPATARLSAGQSLQLSVQAVYSDDTRRDVTRLTRFHSNDSAVATVDDLGRVAIEPRSGEAAVVAQYQGQAAVSRIVVPGPQSETDVAARLVEFPVRNLVDRHVRDKLAQLRIPPAALADEPTFLRRATLQIAGRLPTLDESRQVLEAGASGEDQAEGRRVLIERLLASEDYADHFAQKWADLLRVKRRGQADRLPGTVAFHRWIRNALATDLPYDQFVREILTATGDVTVNPPAQWYAEVRYLDRYVDDTAQVFLGIRIGCARCHHHPFEKFSQEDYFGLAAFFARVDRKGGSGVAERRVNEVVLVKPDGDVKHPLTGQVVKPRGLDGPPLDIRAYDDPRRHLVDWMTTPDNPYFARALVNRLWAHFFGRGLVEPLDDMRITNPPASGDLLDELAREFIDSRFDVKHVVRLICNSTTYQLSSQADASNLDETRNHAWFYPQRLTAEILLDSIDQVTGQPTGFSGLPVGTRAVQLPDEDYSNEFLRLFGRPPRESACECERTSEPSLSQSLFVMNNPFLLAKVNAAKGYAATLAADPRGADEKLAELVLRVLVRRPTDDERRQALRYLSEETDPRIAYGNLLWALINTKEFLFVH